MQLPRLPQHHSGRFRLGLRCREPRGGCRVVANKDAQPFWLTTTPPADFTPTGVWYWNFVYRREVERGDDDHDDLYLPGIIRATLKPGESLTLIASTEAPDATAPLVEGSLDREQRPPAQAGQSRQA